MGGLGQPWEPVEVSVHCFPRSCEFMVTSPTNFPRWGGDFHVEAAQERGTRTSADLADDTDSDVVGVEPLAIWGVLPPP